MRPTSIHYDTNKLHENIIVGVIMDFVFINDKLPLVSYVTVKESNVSVENAFEALITKFMVRK